MDEAGLVAGRKVFAGASGEGWDRGCGRAGGLTPELNRNLMVRARRLRARGQCLVKFL